MESITRVLNRIQEIKQKMSELTIERKTPTPGPRSEFSFKKALEEVKTPLPEKASEKMKISSPILPQTEIDGSIEMASKKYKISSNLIRAVIKNESNFNAQAISSKGAKGLMQIMPETAKTLGIRDVFSIQENIEGGTRYLRQLMDRYQGDLVKTLTAYNAGPSRVNGEKIPNIRETRQYIERVVDSYLRNSGVSQ